MLRSVSIRSVLQQFRSGHAFRKQEAKLSIFEVWDHLDLPDNIPIRPVHLDGGVLTCRVASSVVAAEVSLMQQTYLDAINGYFGVQVVTELRTRVG